MCCSPVTPSKVLSQAFQSYTVVIFIHSTFQDKEIHGSHKKEKKKKKERQDVDPSKSR